MIYLIGMCVAGLAVLILGAELLTRSAVLLSQQLHIPPIIIGLTVVALGTSTPELAVGIDAALKGQGALAVANIAGTNTVNILLILGLSALIKPLALQEQTLHMDLPAIVVAASLMLGLSVDGVLSRGDGVLLLAVGMVYAIFILRAARRESRLLRAAVLSEYSEPQIVEGRTLRTVVSIVKLVVGIALVVSSADWLVAGATGLAGLWGVSDAFVGLTIVAIGTSAPELATTVMSTIKGDRDVAIGNLLGSSVYNICIILGITCVIPATGLEVAQELLRWDIPIMVAVAIACVPIFRSGRRVSQVEGGLLVGAYLTYLVGLLLTRL